MPKRFGLRLYLALAFAIFAVAIGAAFSVVAGRVVFETLEERIGAVLVRGGVEALFTIDRELRERQDDLDNYATMVRHAGALGIADLEWIGVGALTVENERNFGCDWAAGTDSDGDVVVASTNGPARGVRLGNEPWFARARVGPTAYGKVDTPAAGRPAPTVILARPLKDKEHKTYAIVVCQLGPDWAEGLAKRVEEGLPGAESSTNLIVMDAANHLVMLSSRIADQTLPEELLKPGAFDQSRWTRMRWPDGNDYVVGTVAQAVVGPAAQLGWRVAVRRLATDAMRPATALRDRIYVFSAAIALIAALIGAVAASRILVPLRRITEAAQQIGAGELGVHIPDFRTYREVETLSNSLRTMLASLRGNEARLAALNENLDQRVRQRTGEIAEAHEALRRQESRLRAVIETAIDGVLIVGDGNRIETFNPACESIFGWKASEVVGHSVGELIVGEGRSRRGRPIAFDELIESSIDAGDSRGHIRTVRGRRRDGTSFPLEISLSRTMIQEVPIYVAILRDVTEAVRAHDELFGLATKDGLTGLRNRRYFLEGAETEFARARRHGRGFSLLLIDADHFKQVNDTFGHDAGDRVLQGIAEATVGSLREADLVGRLGGEEFAVAMPEVELETAHVVAERLRQLIADSDMGTAESGSLRVTVSIGVAAASPEDQTLNQMLRRADQALYAAKHAGRNKVALAEPVSVTDGS